MKHKLEYGRHILFEAVGPSFLCNILCYLRENKRISGDLITLADTHTNRLDTQSDNVDETSNLTDLLANQLDIPIPINIEEVFEPEDTNDHLDQYRSVANEACLLSVSPQSEMENGCTITPGEGSQLKSIMNDEFCKELSFPDLFPTGKFGCKVKRNINLRPVKYFNQRLLHFSQKFASDTDYFLFHAMFCKT